LGPDTKIEWFIYNAGPSAMEAIFAKSIDLTYVGSGPALNAYTKSNGQEIRLIAGAANGGSGLVVQPEQNLKAAADFRGKKVATTILVSSVKFLNEQRDLAKKFAQAHAELTDWIIKNPEEAQRLIKAELLEETKSDMTPQVIASGWKRIAFTSETPRAVVEK